MTSEKWFLMKHIVYLLGFLFASCVPASAQTGASGTWLGESGLTVVLKADGSALTGTVSNGGINPQPIFDGRIDGNTITFKSRTADGDRTITFTGNIGGDEISFTRDVQVREGGRRGGRGIFGVEGPPQFTVTRVTEVAGEGVEVAAAVNLPRNDIKVEGTLFLPQRSTRVRAVIVAIRWGLGEAFYVDPQLRRLVEGTESGVLLAKFSNIGPSTLHGTVQEGGGAGAEGLLMLLQRFAQESGHEELTEVPILIWAFSAAGRFAETFAAVQSHRTLAFVLYQTSGVVRQEEVGALSHIPALRLAGSMDSLAPIEWAEAWLKRGRSVGAPWTFGIVPGATHGSEEHRKKANDIVIPWITAVLRQRLSPDGGPLRVVADASASLGNNETGDVASFSTFLGSKADASWLPDEATARGWQAMRGAAK